MQYNPKFPKPGKKKRAKPKATSPEVVIQRQAEQLCNIYGIPFLRLSDTLMRTVFANPAIPLHTKKILSDELKGIQDLILFNPENKTYEAIEVKTEIGKLSHSQRAWQKKLNGIVCNGFESTRQAIEDFRND